MKNIDLKNVIDKLVGKLDAVSGVMGFLLGIFILAVCYAFNLSQQSIGIAVLLASLIYIVARAKIKKNPYTISQLISNLSPQNKVKLDVLFYGVFLLSILIYYFQSYKRSIPYFILIIFLAALITIEIVYSKNDENNYSSLLKIILLSLNVRVGIYYAYPSLIGYDAYTHAHITDLISSMGYVPPIEMIAKYASYPMFHLFISLTKVICQLTTKNAIFYSIGLASVLMSTFFVYLIGKRLVSSQVGLFSALMLNLHNYNIVRGIANVTPGSLVLCYLLICLFLVFRQNQNVENKILLITITFIMILTHQLTTFVSFLTLAFLLIGIYISNILNFRKLNSFQGINMNYIILFAVSVQAYWMSTYVNSDISFFEMVLAPLLNVLQSGGEYGSDVLITGYEYQRGLFETIILHSCYLIMPFLVIGGVLLWTSSRDYRKFSYAFAISGMYAIIYVFPVLGMRNLLTTRWIPLLSILLVIAASAYIFEFVYAIKSNKSKLFVILMVISVFTSLMLITPAVNKDAPVIEKDRTTRNQFKYSEMYAADTITNSYSGDIRLDSLFAICARAYGNESDDDLSPFTINYIEANSTAPDDELVVLRPSTLNEPISVGYSDLFGLGMDVMLPDSFFERFKTSNYDLIYNNGDVLSYMGKQTD